MKILHTSDWHLGAEYFHRPRGEEHAAFLTWLLQAVVAHRVDAVVVAGDIFDNASPSAEAQSQYYRFLAALSAEGGKAAVVVGGNHDSASRLDAPREVLSALATTVVGGYAPDRAADELCDPAGVLVPLRRGGEVEAVVAAVPYLHDWRLGVRDFDAAHDDQRRSLADAFRAVYGRLADRAQAQFPGVPLLATGHLTCLPQAGQKLAAADGNLVEINRVGTLGAMGPDIFDERFGYVALGHIHRGFCVDGADRIWYSGTPVQMSRVEGASDRRVLLIDTDARGPAGGLAVEKLETPVRRRLVHLSGEYDAVAQELAALTWPDAELPPYVSVEARRADVQLAAEQRLRELAPDGPGGPAVVVEARIAVAAGPAAGPSPLDALPDAAEITPEQAFRFAWEARHHGHPPDDDILQRFRSLLSDDDDARAAAGRAN